MYSELTIICLVMFGASGIARVFELSRTGTFTKQIFVQSSVGAVFVIVGSIIGLKFLHLISDKTLRIVVNVFLFLMGLRYLNLE